MRKPEITEGPCYRENCPGPMVYDDGIFQCQSCGFGSTVKDYIHWFKYEPQSNPYIDDAYEGVPGYYEIYDLDGNYIFCPECEPQFDTPLKGCVGEVVCPRCGTKFKPKDIPELDESYL